MFPTTCVSLIGGGEIEDLLKTLGVRYEKIKSLSEAKGVVVIDRILKPGKKATLEKRYEIALYDRADVILFLFEAHASPLGKLQIKLERFRRALSPAKDKDREKLILRRRIKTIQDKIRKLQKIKHQSLERLKKKGFFIIPLVGYTNAGKSTLFNALIGKEKAEVRNELFTTSIVRTALVDIGIKAILVDTVGFISNVPESLIPAYRSTLDSLNLADLVLHVIDGSDPRAREKAKEGEKIISQKTDSPALIVINKKDLGPTHVDGDVFISAKNREFDGLFEVIKKNLNIFHSSIFIPLEKASLLNQIPLSIKKKIEKRVDGFNVELVGKEETIKTWINAHPEVLERARDLN